MFKNSLLEESYHTETEFNFTVFQIILYYYLQDMPLTWGHEVTQLLFV